MSNLKIAMSIASKAHDGQKQWNGDPLISHPKRVMDLIVKQNPDLEITEDYEIAAILHDVVEDTEVGLQDLSDVGFSPEVVSAVHRLTRQEGESYTNYIERLRVDPIAVIVKIADLSDNTDMTRLNRPIRQADIERQRKYLRAMSKLLRVRDFQKGRKMHLKKKRK